MEHEKGNTHTLQTGVVGDLFYLWFLFHQLPDYPYFQQRFYDLRLPRFLFYPDAGLVLLDNGNLYLRLAVRLSTAIRRR